MAPFESLTSVNVYRVLGILAVLWSLGLGLVSLYHGISHPPNDIVFGMDDDVSSGVWWLFSAMIWAYVYRHIVRQEASVVQ